MAAALFCCLELIGCGGSSTASPVSATPVTAGTSSAPSGSSSVAIVMNAMTLGAKAFNPNPITVAVGTSITWTNTDAITHTSTADAGAWSSGLIPPGTTFTASFPTAGTYTYHCTIHPGMVGTVIAQ
jgi:plastocyanin